MLADPTLNKEYLPIDGHVKFRELSQKLLFATQAGDRITTVQSLSGTGALSVGATFIKTHGPAAIWVSAPTWPNHNQIFSAAGLPVKAYPYWNPKTRGVDFEGMKKALRTAAPGDVILLHACAHNPTGCDPTFEQWKELETIIAEQKLYPFFDIAYQGFASGDLDNDAKAIRYFAEKGHSFLVA